MNRWLFSLNLTLLAAALFLGLAGLFYWLKQPEEIICKQLGSKQCGLPKTSFELAEKDYEEAGMNVLALSEAPPTIQLPDLKQQLTYYGKNGRPDTNLDRVLLHFSLSSNNKATASIKPEEKLYLVYDRNSSTGRYIFSPNNEQTSLWIAANPIGNEAEIEVKMLNDKGEEISEPDGFAHFKLPEKEFIRIAGTTWEIGSQRVDGTLLARQRARWCGGDRFLEKHGGEEFKDCVGRERIDLGENDALYSVFVKAGDCLVFNQTKWVVVVPGLETVGLPLLVVKKVDERLMTFELWDPEGRGKILLNLLKSSEPWALQSGQNLQHMFKFLGSRTKTQSVFEINRERVILRPSDWLLLTPKGWKKLSSEQEIDDYVKRKLTGTLFVFEGISRKDERQVMEGTLYSPSRNESKTVEIPLHVGSGGSAGNGSKIGDLAKEAKEKELKDKKEAQLLDKNPMRAPEPVGSSAFVPLPPK